MVPDPKFPKEVVHEGKLWEIIRVGGFYGYVPARHTAPTEKPWMDWEGGRISMDVWGQILAFFEWSQQEFKSEVQVRLFYNKVTRRWTSWAFPQRPNGMTTNEIEDHPLKEVQRKQFQDPWILLGTVHHHCTSSAFQSSTDKNNECNQEGLHITVGNIGSEEYSLHGRVVCRSTEYGCDWSDWFEVPQKLVEVLPERLQPKILDYYLKCPPPKDTPFPETWKTNCIRSFSAGGSHSDNNFRASTKYIIKTDLAGQFKTHELQWMHNGALLFAAAEVNQNLFDALAFEKGAVVDGKLEPRHRALVDCVLGRGIALGLTQNRMDQLSDCWDFETVLEELKFEPNPKDVEIPTDILDMKAAGTKQ